MLSKTYRLFIAILYGLSAIFILGDHPACAKTVLKEPDILKELPTIWQAAVRNKCYCDDFLILLAIRKAENGGPGREFGILHPKCLAQIEREPERSLDIQAGWAAATIVKNKIRWHNADRPGDFIMFLGERYCSEEADPQGHINWVRNVKFWFKKFKR